MVFAYDSDLRYKDVCADNQSDEHISIGDKHLNILRFLSRTSYWDTIMFGGVLVFF